MQRGNELGDALKKSAVAGDTTVSPTNVSVASFQSALASQPSPATAFNQGGLQHYVIAAPIQSMPTSAATATAAAAVAPPNRQAADMLGASSLTPAQNLQQPAPSQQAVVVTQGGSLTATHSALSVQDANTIQQVLSLAASSAAGLQQQQQSLSGSTIHHHGQQLQISATSAGITPLSVCVTNHHHLQQQPQLGFSMNLPTSQRVAQRHPSGPAQGISVPLTTSDASGASGTCSSLDITPVLTTSTGSFPLTVSSNTVLSTGVPPPRKRIKLEEKPPSTPEIAAYRKKILDHKRKEMSELKENHKEHWTERYFLKNSGNIMDFFHWKKRPTPQLIQFLKDKNLDSDDDDDIATEPKSSEPGIKNTGNVGNILSSPSLPTSVATTLTPTLAALTQQGTTTNLPVLTNAPANSAASASNTSSTVPTATATGTVTTTTVTTVSTTPTATDSLPGTSTITSQMLPTHSLTSLTMSTKNTTDVKTSLAQSTQMIKNALLSPTVGSQCPRTSKSPTSPAHRLNTRQQAISAVYDSAIGSQEAIVERAKQEAQVMHRVAELRKDGLWSARRLPKVQEPTRNKAHWDYLLEEMQWLAADFAQERKWKKAAARKLSRMVAKYHQEQEQKEQRAVKEEAQKLKRIASQVAKQVKEFWANIEKVVQYKQQTRLEEKRRKALDLHLNFIVDQTEKYSSWLTEGLAKSGRGNSVSSSVVGSISSTPEHSSASGDDDFEPDQSETDDEETIEREERETEITETNVLDEIALLKEESSVPLEELLKMLPGEILEKTPPEEKIEKKSNEVSGSESENRVSDEEFQTDDQDEEDMEDTIEEQEKHENKEDHLEELSELQKESEMSMEELVKKYEGAYGSDLEKPEEELAVTSDDDTEEYDDGSDNDDTEEEEEEDDVASSNDEKEEIGLEYLMHPEIQEGSQKACSASKGKGPSKEITDIAAEALSLQPKGNTLETTQVKVAVPFLLKHHLREYQHVGLDWLATMHEKKLNGILADEMGLGKTIQTIALLAHLACDKGVWGPHLIVVPTSVMLNWEMEFKKWCPAFKILTYYGNPKERKAKRTGWTKTNAFHICITSYKLVIQDHQAFRRKKWKYFILDEAQNIKNFKSQRWQTLLNFQSQRRLLLTGTPLQNSLMELWSLMHFLMPNVFASHKDFKEWFANPLSGMIEGSHEYNDNLIKRLHKVLRPFLLRRLKDDVEKQMPKKYEHVIMCRLSKRQRFLYDEFMSQTKTKETLATGHFMSVINVLMQLRKVCNHPNLFDPRPIVSPFQMQGLVYSTASQIIKAMESGPFDSVDLRLLYPSLCDMEYDLPKFISERVLKLQTSRNLILEIDSQPDPPPRPKSAKLKSLHLKSSSLIQPGRGSPILTTQTATTTPTTVITAKPNIVKPVTVIPQAVNTTASVCTTQPTMPIRIGLVPQIRTNLPHQQTQGGVSGTPSSIAAVVLSSASVGTSQPTLSPLPSFATIQAKVLPPGSRTNFITGTLHTSTGVAATTSTSSSTSTSVLPSQPFTVQIQQTDQGTRLMIPTGQFSQFSTGFIQIVQTSSGQQLIATSTPPVQSVIPVQTVTTSSAVPVVNGPGLVSSLSSSSTSVAGSSSSSSNATSVTSVPTLVKTTPTVHLPITTAAATAGKPVMKVQPLSTELSTMHYQHQQKSSQVVLATAAAATTTTTPSMAQTLVTTRAAVHGHTSIFYKHFCPSTTKLTTALAKPVVHQPKSEFYLESLHLKRKQCRKEKLNMLDQINKRHCDMKVVYGQNLLDSLSLMKIPENQEPALHPWQGQRYFHCQKAHLNYSYKFNSLWYRTEAIEKMVHTPEQYLEELSDILSRFVFAIPAVSAPNIKLHVSHPSASATAREEYQRYILHKELAPKASCLHKNHASMSVLFPELRLIQYDCGKLQTLDILLRQLKTGHHRVLIFTQMTKMLDVLETFLNYHGHRYLRLDGTTRVEQRQALMERFNADKRIFVFILSTRSGGIGVNLTGADTVIFYDSDWNPTMDAQAQDRCHRIGQTRDVHIYRLISERTIEENILKKADQKRLLGDVAIEGGNFTTAFFKQNTIKELFDEPSGLHGLAKEKEARAHQLEKRHLESQQTVTTSSKGAKTTPEGTGKESNLINQLEQALCKAEDETDVIAADLVKAEQKAELAEFDENIPWDDKEAEKKQDDEETSKAEMELSLLEKELSPVERYAVLFMETQMEPFCAEELQMAEEDIECAKKDWELARLKSLKEEEEMRAELEEDEMLFTYTRDDAYNQVKKSKKSNSVSKSNKNSNSKIPKKVRVGRKSSRRSAGSSDIAKSRSSGVHSTKRSSLSSNNDVNSDSDFIIGRGGKVKGSSSYSKSDQASLDSGHSKQNPKKDTKNSSTNTNLVSKSNTNQKCSPPNSILNNQKAQSSGSTPKKSLTKKTGLSKRSGTPATKKTPGPAAPKKGKKSPSTKKSAPGKSCGSASSKKTSSSTVPKKAPISSTTAVSKKGTGTKKTSKNTTSKKSTEIASSSPLSKSASTQVMTVHTPIRMVSVPTSSIQGTTVTPSSQALPTNVISTHILPISAANTQVLTTTAGTKVLFATGTQVMSAISANAKGIPLSGAKVVQTTPIGTQIIQGTATGTQVMPVINTNTKQIMPMTSLTQKVPVTNLAQKVPISHITKMVPITQKVGASKITKKVQMKIPETIIAQNIQGTTITQKMPVNAIAQKVPMATLTQKVPINTITQKVPINTITQKVPITVTQKIPVTTVAQKVSMATVTQKVPITTAMQKVPITTAMQKVPITTAMQKVPITTAMQKVPITMVTQKGPITTVTQKVPITTAMQKGPITTVTQKVPITAMTQKVPISTVTQRVPISRVPISTVTQRVPISRMPISTVTQRVPISRVPISTVTQKVPISMMTQKMPISTVTQKVPINTPHKGPITTITHKVPFTTITHIPVSTITPKISTPTISQVPITPITQVPVTAIATKIPTTITQANVSAITQNIGQKLPITTITQKLPISTLAHKVPVTIATQKLPVSVLQQKLPMTIATQRMPATTLTQKFIVSTPTQKLLVSTPTQRLLVPTQAQKLLVPTQTQKLLVTSSTQKILVSAPTQKLLVSAPTQTLLVSTAPSQKLPLLSTPTQTILPKAATTLSTQNCPTVNHVENVLSVPVKYTSVIPTPITTATSSTQPWSNPNLVIRTRRASMQESKKRADSSESSEPDMESLGNENIDHVINVTNNLNNIIIDLPESLRNTDTITDGDGKQILKISQQPNSKQIQNLNGPKLSEKITTYCIESGDILPENG